MAKATKNSKNNSKTLEKSPHSRDDLLWWSVFGAIVLLSCGTRLYNVQLPEHVCWDETHFGKMGSWYINRTFFFDVHPPFGKMLIALSGYLTGYDGTYPFEKPGELYGNTSYVGMRVFCTVLGLSVVPLGYLTVWEMTFSLEAATLAAAFLVSDVGISTLTRYILLDPILLFFMMASVYGHAKFHSQFDKPFSLSWWNWLLFTGFMMASCISVKFVGLFTIIYIGFRTVEELWTILGDVKKPFMYTLKHFFARVIGLIIFPLLVYTVYFYIHLEVLNRSGTGDGFYSSGFQARLIGNSLHNSSAPKEVAYGAIISLKNHRTSGAYLHSHPHLYPEGVGARQQQITTYSHKDTNNHWRVKHYNKEYNENSTVELLKHGDLIRLEHTASGRNLHSHRMPAPISKKSYQVTGYGEKGRGDANDVWKVLIEGGNEGDVVQTVASKIKLVHYLQHCVLSTSGQQLPKWAYEQHEVLCNPNLRDKNSLWNVEENIFSQLPNVSFAEYSPGFLERFLESHAVMFQGNAGLKPKEGEDTSKPWQWPINYRGQFFSAANEFKIYLLGNPVVWWGNLFFLFVFVLVFVEDCILHQRGYRDPPQVAKCKEKILRSSLWLFASWLLHYVPFWTMGRVLYFHHYFPALIFNSMLSGVIVSYILESAKHTYSKNIGNVLYHTMNVLVYGSVIYSFYIFAPLTYGMNSAPATEPNSTMYGYRWLKSWEF